MTINILTFILASPFIYLLGYVFAALMWSHSDFQAALRKYEEETGKVAPDTRIWSWYFIWINKNWLLKEIKHLLIKIKINYIN